MSLRAQQARFEDTVIGPAVQSFSPAFDAKIAPKGHVPGIMAAVKFIQDALSGGQRPRVAHATKRMPS